MAISAAGDSFNYQQGPLSATAQLVGIIGGDYPTASTPITSSSGNVAAAAATATLAGAASLTTYITGFEFTSSGSTVGGVVTITITGTVSGTLHYTYSSVAGAVLANQPLLVQFSPPIPASAANTAIVVSCPSLGAGNTNATMVAHGYRR